MCVGVSAYRATRDEAVVEADEAALEELVAAIGLKIADPFFRENVITGYSEVRAKALSSVQTATDGGNPAAEVLDPVNKARKRVVELLRVSGGPAVPALRSDWRWEEYAAKKGGTETMVFVRYDVTLDAVKALIERYSAAHQVLGSTAVTALPAHAWQYPDLTGGALLTKVGRPLADSGVAAQSVVMTVGDTPVGDVSSLTRRLDEWKQATGDLKLTVKSGTAAPRVITIPRARAK